MLLLISLQIIHSGVCVHSLCSSGLFIQGKSEEEEASGEKGEQDSQRRAGKRHLLPPAVR